MPSGQFLSFSHLCFAFGNTAAAGGAGAAFACLRVLHFGTPALQRSSCVCTPPAAKTWPPRLLAAQLLQAALAVAPSAVVDKVRGSALRAWLQMALHPQIEVRVKTNAVVLATSICLCRSFRCGISSPHV